MAEWETLELLVTVKAYPVVSDMHGECVCVAGIRTDTPVPAWVRLFPVPFRDLPYPQRFKKYDIVRLRARRTSSDTRPESYLPDANSVRVLGHLDSRRDWSKRRSYVEPLRKPSMCAIQSAQVESAISLGVFRPRRVLDLVWEDAQPRSTRQQAKLDQRSLFDSPSVEGLEEIPYKFRYRYQCEDCAGNDSHQQRVLDWEIGQAYRSWRTKYGEERALRGIRKKWLVEMASSAKDLHFFVGNIARFPRSFCVLGCFYPPLRTSTVPLF